MGLGDRGSEGRVGEEGGDFDVRWNEWIGLSMVDLKRCLSGRDGIPEVLRDRET